MSAPRSTGARTEPDCRRTRGDFVGQEGFIRAGEILALVVVARGRRRWPADSAERPGGSAASEGGAPRDRHPPRGAFRHVADRWPLRCAPRRQLGSNVRGTNPVGQVCLLLHVSSVDEGHADGPAANLQVRETRLTPTVASCPALCR